MKFLVEILNYKKIKDFKAKMESGYLYFISGGNEKGKTSFVRAIGTLLNAQNKNVNPITFGEEKCVISSQMYDFTGANNEVFSIKFEMEKDKEKFILIKPDNKASTSVTEIRDIFKWNSFSVDDWFSWGTTAEGRRKQAETIKSLFPKETIDRLNIIDGMINSKNGITYKKRTENNSAMKICDTRIKSNELTLIEKEQKELYEAKKKEINEIEYEISKISNPVLLQEISNLNNKAGIIQEKVNAISTNCADFVKEKQQENLDIQKQIETLQLKYNNNVKLMNMREQAKTNDINELAKEFSKLKDRKEEIKSQIPIDADIKTADLKEQLEKAQALISNIKYNDIIFKETTFNNEKANYKKLEENSIVLQNELDKLAKEKSDIFTKTQLPLNNISIVDDECMFVQSDNMLPYTEEHVSYSQGGVPIAEMLMNINKTTKIVLLGKASEYSENALEKLSEIAKKYDGIIIGDQVKSDKEPLTFEIYEKL